MLMQIPLPDGFPLLRRRELQPRQFPDLPGVPFQIFLPWRLLRRDPLCRLHVAGVDGGEVVGVDFRAGLAAQSGRLTIRKRIN